MRKFTISNCCPGSFGLLDKLVTGLVLSVVMVLFNFTDGYAQSEAVISTDMRYTEGVTDDFDPEDYTPSKTFVTSKDLLTPAAPNPGLGENTTCANLRVAFVLDESRSIITRNAVDQVKEAALGLAEAFQGSPAFISVIEFDQQARIVDLGTNQVSGTFISNMEAYLYDESGFNGQTYAPAPEAGPGCKKGYTNWEDALLAVDSDINLVIFVTDGDPTAHNANNSCGYVLGTGDAFLEPAIVAANNIKANGTHMFVIGVGDNIFESNIHQISGTSNFALGGDIWNTDYLVGSFADLKDNLTAGLNAICGTEIDIQKTVDFNQVCSDETITFTLTVTNTGGNNGYHAAGVVVTDTFPSQFENLAIVGEALNATLIGQVVNYEVGELAPGESASIEISASVGSAATGSYTNIAYANAVNANKVNGSVTVEKTGLVTSQETIVACESFVWNGQTYDQSDSYTFDGVNENGCPTLETLVLTINTPQTSEINAEACGSWTWERTGEVFTETVSGEQRIFAGENGQCDETVTLNITIVPAIEIVELCSEMPYIFPYTGEDFWTPGTYEIQINDVLCAILQVGFGEGGSCYLPGDVEGTPTGIITENCECEGTPVEEFDCPELSLNIGDNCDDGDDTTENDQVGEDCTCAGTPIPPVYECPEFEANIGDACTDSEGRSGTLTNDCDCYVPFECTADAGSVFFNDGTTEKTFCADDGIPSTFEFLFLPGNLSDSTAAIITDAAGYGLFMTRDIAEGEAFDFDLLGIGTWHVYIATYNGGHSNGNHLIFDLFLNGIPVNISDLDGCFDISNQLTLIGESCQPVYECPEFEANIGDACTDSEGKSGTLTDDCDCYVPFECTADAGSVAFSDGSFEKTFCADDDIASTFEFLYIPGNLTDSTAAIITDDSGLAYAMIRDVAVGEAFDFDQLGIGTWHIYIASYNGDHSNGNHLVFDLFLNGLPVYVSDLEGCYDLSDPLTLIGESCVPEVDCEDLGLNIGDPCDDGDDTTENDQVGEDCICAGTPVPPVYDCEEYQANIGDDCWENDQKGVLDENCDCVGGGTPVTDCNEFAYFITNNKPGQSATIYGITLTGGVAEMHFIADYPEELHLAYNQEEKLLYGISKMSTMYVTMDPYAAVPAFGPQVALNEAPGEVTGAVFSPQGELLISSQTKKAIFIVDLVTNDLIQYDDYAPVFGGDMAYSADGTLYLVTNTGGALYEVVPEGVGNDVLIVNTDTKKNTGMAITANDQLLISVHGHSALTLLNTDGTSAGSIPLMLNGESFVLDYGDMASGCSSYKDPDDNTCSNFATFYTHYNEVTEESDIYSVEFDGSSANLTHLLQLPFEVHIGYDGENDLLYMVSKTGSFFRVYDVGADLVLGDVPFSTTLNDVTAVEFSVHDKQLYIGHQRFKNIYKVDPANGQVQLHGSAPIYGGDIAIFNNGNAYLSSQTGQMLYNISDINNPVGVGNIPVKVSGMTLMGENLVTSNYGSDVFYEISTADASVQNTYTALFNGEPFEVGFGDMAGGCRSIENDKILGLKTAAQNEAAQATLTAFPNPTEGESKVVFQTTENTKALVEVYDMNGRVVATLFDQDANAGQSYTLDFNGNKLPNGIYVYRLTTQNETIIEKFMIAR